MSSFGAFIAKLQYVKHVAFFLGHRHFLFLTTLKFENAPTCSSLSHGEDWTDLKPDKNNRVSKNIHNWLRNRGTA